MSQDSLISKLDELDRLFTNLGAQMEDPTVASNAQQFIRVATEHAQLSRIVEPYRLYKKLLDNSEQAQAILDDPDSDNEMRQMANVEVEELKPQIDDAMEVVKGLLVMSDESQIDSVLLEIRAGTGGDEAALFAGNLLNMYQQYAGTRGWSCEIMSASPTELGGFKEVIVSIKGSDVWARLGYEGGGHRVQRVPKTESQGRIHTSAATVAVLPEPKNVEVTIDWDKDVVEHTMRAGGPGGQNVNKVESAIKLEHLDTGITVSMRDEKSQHKNRAKGRRIMAIRVNEFYMQQQQKKEGDARKKMIGSGDRSQRIRTYNFPQNRCTDHRLKGDGAEGANYNLDRIMNGDLDDLIDALVTHDKAQRLANL